MTYSQITQNIYSDNKKIYKTGKKRICILTFCACLCLGLLDFAGPLFQSLYNVTAPAAVGVMPETTYYLLFNMALYIVCLVLPFIIAMAVCKTGIKAVFPLKPRLTRNPIGFILFAFGICLLLNTVLSMLTPWYNELFPADDFLYQDRTDIFLYFIQVAVLPPIIEEFVFRGVTIAALRPMGTKFAVIFSAILFGLFHANPLQSIFATLFGLLLGSVYVATGSIWPCMLLHFFNNAFAVVADYSAQMAENGNVFLLMVLNLLAYGAMAYSIVYLIKFLKLPGRFTMAIKDQKEALLTGSGFSPVRAVFTNVWTYLFVIMYVIALVVQIMANLAKGTGV